MKILTADEMRHIDQECARLGLSTSRLMEKAGEAVAEEVRCRLGCLEEQHVLCLVGPGNNGGDGLVAARCLHDWGAHVSVYLCGQRPPDDPNLRLAQERGIKCVAAAQDKSLKGFGELLASATCVLDALLGTGRLRPLGGVFREVLGRVAEAKKERDLCIIAVDLPSGLDADTGAVDPACLAVDMTVTLAFPKVGLFSFPGAARVGELKIADIGIPEHLAASVKTELITADLARASLPGRPPDANKGSFGRVLVAAGSVSYIGAAYLACSGALRVGAGLVTLATASSLQPIIAAKLAEATYLPLPEDGSGIIAAGAAKTLSEALGRYDVLLLGCGLGQHPSTAGFVRALLSAEAKPAVLDADALNILSQVPAWWQLFGEAIITPHPGEMARLCGLKLAEVQADRLGVARNFAAKWHKVIVLKGAYSVIAAPDGQVAVSPFANPGLASGGTGDVLAGAIAGLVAQGRPLFEAASLGVYLHGVAGEMVKESLGEAGMLASDLLPVLPVVIKRLKE